MRTLISLSLALLFLTSTHLFAEEDLSPEPEKKSKRFFYEYPVSIKARGAYFWPQAHALRSRYGKHFADYSLELAYLLSRRWSVFLNGSIYHKHGHTKISRKKTNLTAIPLTLGINFYLHRSLVWRPYVGVGGGAAYVRFRDRSLFHKEVVSRWGEASFAQLGLEMNLTQRCIIDLFGGYRKNWVSFPKSQSHHHHHIQTGGWELGAGIGSRF